MLTLDQGRLSTPKRTCNFSPKQPFRTGNLSNAPFAQGLGEP